MSSLLRVAEDRRDGRPSQRRWSWFSQLLRFRMGVNDAAQICEIAEFYRFHTQCNWECTGCVQFEDLALSSMEYSGLDVLSVPPQYCSSVAPAVGCGAEDQNPQRNSRRPVLTGMSIGFIFLVCDVDCVIIQSIASRNRNSPTNNWLDFLVNHHKETFSSLYLPYMWCFCVICCVSCPLTALNNFLFFIKMTPC